MINLALLKLFPNNRTDYFAADIDKDMLLEQTPSPRIIFVGGSNLAFSLDSVKTEHALALPVVNMGLHAGLGLRYMLSQVQAHVRAGDLVVVSAEYHYFSNGASIDGDAASLGSLVSALPSGLRYMRTPQQFINVFLGLLQWEQGKVLNPASSKGVYVRAAFNSHGDVVGHLGLPSIPFTIASMFDAGNAQAFNPEAVDILNELSATATARGGRVFLIWPGIPDSTYALSQQGIDTLYQRVSAQARFLILGLPQSASYPVTDFYDSDYHMNAEGRAANTDRIVEELKTAMAPGTR